MPRLKVFVSSDGLTDYVVAASSRPKALAAWGAHQDLFKTGGARETDDPDLVAAALAQPGQVLRRPAELPNLPKAARKPRAAPKPVAPPKPRGPSPAALRRVAEAEARLAKAEADHARDLARLDAARRRLDADAQAADARYAQARAAAEQALAEARQGLVEG